MIDITECPKATVPGEVWESFRGAELAERGSWPNGGGWLHECDSFVEAVRLVRVEEAYARRANRGE